MPSKSALQLVSFAICALLMFPLAGCTTDTAPVQTSADELDQYLADNPDEAYSSDGSAEEMSADEEDGEGDDGSGDEAAE